MQNRQDPEDYKVSTNNFHYGNDEYISQMGSRAYRLQPHEKSSINEIEEKLNSGFDLAIAELLAYRSFLSKLSYNVREILQEEKMVQIRNLNLETDLRRIVELQNKISLKIDN